MRQRIKNYGQNRTMFLFLLEKRMHCIYIIDIHYSPQSLFYVKIGKIFNMPYFLEAGILFSGEKAHVSQDLLV